MSGAAGAGRSAPSIQGLAIQKTIPLIFTFLTPEKKQMNNPFYYSLTRRSRVQSLPTRARNNDTWDRRRIVSNMR